MKTQFRKEYLAKSEKIFSPFSKIMKDYVSSLKNLRQTEEKFKEMEALYNLNDFDVIKESLIRKDTDFFKNYC